MAFNAGVVVGKLKFDNKEFMVSCKQVTAGQKDMATKAGAAGTAFKGMWKQVAAGFGITQVVAGGIRAMKAQFSDMIDKGREFEKEWANVTTMISDTSVNTELMREELLRLSPTLGSTTDLARGMYQVLSASVEPAKAIEFLGEAAKSAKAGVTDANTAVDALTTVINAYGLEAAAVTDVSDIMFQTVKRGKLTYEELAHALGTCVPVAATVGVEFDEVAAAIATMTRQGIDSGTATMQLRQVMMSILKPSEDALKCAEELGLEWSASGLKAKGLSGFMEELRLKTGGNSETLARLVPNVRALTGVMVLAGAGAEGFKEDLDLMAEASGNTERAFAKQMESADFWIDTFTVTIDKMKTSFYLGFVDPLKEGITSSEDLDEKIEDLIDRTRTFGKALGTVSKYGFTPFLTQLDLAIEKLQAVNFAKGGSLWSLAETIVLKNIPAFKELEDAIFQADERALRGFNAGIEFGDGLLKNFNNTIKDVEEWFNKTATELNNLNNKTNEAHKIIPKLNTDFIEAAIAQEKWNELLPDTARGLRDMIDETEDGVIWLELLKMEGEETGDALKDVFDKIGWDYGALTLELVEETKQTTEDISKFYEQSIYGIADAFGDCFEDILTEGSDFNDAIEILFDSLVGNIRKALGDLLRDFIKDNIFDAIVGKAKEATSAVTSMVGGAAKGAASGAAGTGASAALSLAGGTGPGALAMGIGAAAGTLIGTLLGGGGMGKATENHIKDIVDNTKRIWDVLFIDFKEEVHIMQNELRGIFSKAEAICPKLDISNEHLQGIRDSLEGTISAQGGFSGTLTRDTMIHAHAGERVDIGPRSVSPQINRHEFTINPMPLTIKINEREIMDIVVEFSPEYSRDGHLHLHTRASGEF